MRLLPSICLALLVTGLMSFMPSALIADDVILKAGIKGKVTVTKDSNGKAASVTITGEKGKTYSISPMKAIDKEAGKNYKVTEEDIAKIAKYENQVVKVGVFLAAGNKVIGVTSVILLTGEPIGGRL